jgi:hypothetical protein
MQIFFIFFLITYPQAHYLQSEKFNFLLKFYFARIISEKGRIRCRIRIRTSDRIRILEAQKLADPADPDPQHCKKGFKRIGPPKGCIFKTRINILETTLKRRHLKISLAVYFGKFGKKGGGKKGGRAKQPGNKSGSFSGYGGFKKW